MCAQEHVRHNDAEPTGVPPFMFTLPMAMLSNRYMNRRLINEGRGTSDSSLFRCSITELRELVLAAGFEPATTRSQSEVSAIYATGQVVSYTGDLSKRVQSHIRSGAVCFGAAPPLRGTFCSVQGLLSLLF